MSTKRISREIEDEICALREAGFTTREIIRRTGVARSTLYKVFRRRGVKVAKHGGWNKVRYNTRDLVRVMENKGTYAAVARHFGWSHETAKKQCEKHGLRSRCYRDDKVGITDDLVEGRLNRLRSGEYER